MGEEQHEEREMEEQTAEIMRQKQDRAGRIGFIRERLNGLEQTRDKNTYETKRIDGGIRRNGVVIAADSMIIHLNRLHGKRRQVVKKVRVDNLGDSFSACYDNHSLPFPTATLRSFACAAPSSMNRSSGSAD